VLPPKAGADDVERARKTILVRLPGDHPETFVAVEWGALEPLLYRGGVMFKTNIEMAAVFVILGELGGIVTTAHGAPWSMALDSLIFARNVEDWGYLKRILERCEPQL
jgi:hypothetical protein